MGRKAKQAAEVNRSQAIRDLLKEKPDIKANDAVTALAEKGITIKASLFYIVKGKVAGGKKRRRRNTKAAVKIIAATTAGNSDALATIVKIKKLAAEVGGIGALKSLVDVLSE
jgi:hypothetical protein